MAETDRLVAWGAELRRVHARIRSALEVTRTAVGAGLSAQQASRELLLYCHGFCAALDGHHRGEDRALFPAIESEHPDLAPVLRSLERDHTMIAHLLGELQAAVALAESPAVLDRHLEGIAAIMENHFRFEERTLLSVLDSLHLAAPAPEVLGPL
ncbi:hemerythrin domain-containing protein [Microbacteriaceae bacterium VKM Ac-2854]|nr:hemerythrin domain-containing protein [Microbacteriaceae bacterium VKM Ac-2854]